MISYKIISQDALDFVTLRQAKRQLNILDSTIDDLNIQLYAQVAMQLVQRYTNRLMSRGVVKCSIKGCLRVELPLGEIVNLTSVEDTDGNAIDHTFSEEFQQITITDSSVNEDTIINVTYEAGYSNVPIEALSGALIMLTELYENRGMTISEVDVNEVPLGAYTILDSIRLGYI